MAINNTEQQLLDPKLIINKSGVGAKMKIADLGCGSNGFFVFPLAQVVGKEGLVFAVDIKKEALENINKRAKTNNVRQVKTVWSDLEIFNATKIETESLDAVFLINILYQSTKRVEMVREAMRMLKRNGKMIIVDWNDAECPVGPPADNKVKEALLKSGIRKMGMRLEDEFSAGNFHYGLIFSKQ